MKLMEKFNEELIRKELLNLANKAIDQIIGKCKEYKRFQFIEEDNIFEVQMKIFHGKDAGIMSYYSDLYTKKQLESVTEGEEHQQNCLHFKYPISFGSICSNCGKDLREYL